MLTASEPSIKPLANIVSHYTCCDGQNALPAFDDLGHGAMVVDYDLQYSGDVDAAIQEMKAWVNVL